MESFLFLEAVKNGDLTLVQTLFQKDNEDGNKVAMDLACDLGFKDILLFLSQNGVSVSHRHLSLAIRKNNVEVVSLLFISGGEVTRGHLKEASSHEMKNIISQKLEEFQYYMNQVMGVISSMYIPNFPMAFSLFSNDQEKGRYLFTKPHLLKALSQNKLFDFVLPLAAKHPHVDQFFKDAKSDPDYVIRCWKSRHVEEAEYLLFQEKFSDSQGLSFFFALTNQRFETAERIAFDSSFHIAWDRCKEFDHWLRFVSLDFFKRVILTRDEIPFELMFHQLIDHSGKDHVKKMKLLLKKKKFIPTIKDLEKAIGEHLSDVVFFILNKFKINIYDSFIFDDLLKIIDIAELVPLLVLKPFYAEQLNSKHIQKLMHWSMNNRVSNMKIYEKLFQLGYRVHGTDENQEHFMSMEFLNFDLFLLFVQHGADPNQVPESLYGVIERRPTLENGFLLKKKKKKPTFFMTEIKPKFEKEYKNLIIQKILIPFIRGTKTKNLFLWKRIVDMKMASVKWNF